MKGILNYLKPIVFLLMVIQETPSMGQDDQPIIDLSDKFLARIYTVTKLNSLEIENLRTDDVIQHLPNGGTNLGLGFNYKRLGLGIAVGLPRNSESQRKFGKTRKLDIQGSMYGKTIGGEAFLQHYKGYYNSNPEDFLDWNQDTRPQLPSMEVWSVGLVGFYIFNSKKYSYRAAFVKDEIQNKSSGSFLAGIFGNLDESSTDNGFIPEEYPDSIKVNVNVKKFSNIATGISLGYAYNLIIRKKILAGIALLPGFGFQNTTYETLSDERVNKNQAAAQLQVRAALGYEHKYFFINITGSVNWRSIELNPYNFNLSTEQFRFILGKRF